MRACVPPRVYERDGDRLVVNAPNCIDCKATDVLGPRWTPREGGSGPAYKADVSAGAGRERRVSRRRPSGPRGSRAGPAGRRRPPPVRTRSA
ncbi:4Fe-4S dicluster domain-containing protein [Candidatus Palauibacter sp.]|uniref:4Fe-4S dicluster domain-containing protein n=1 Tax=Candidatus Palauibacter sp. TaxID=3101350 RepID=UPI003B5956DF